VDLQGGVRRVWPLHRSHEVLLSVVGIDADADDGYGDVDGMTPEVSEEEIGGGEAFQGDPRAPEAAGSDVRPTEPKSTWLNFFLRVAFFFGEGEKYGNLQNRHQRCTKSYRGRETEGGGMGASQAHREYAAIPPLRQ